jgi:hypothetical protein
MPTDNKKQRPQCVMEPLTRAARVWPGSSPAPGAIKSTAVHLNWYSLFYGPVPSEVLAVNFNLSKSFPLYHVSQLDCVR